MSRSHERALAGENRRSANLSEPQKVKLRAMLDDYHVAQAMRKGAYERHKEISEELIAAQREHSKLTSAQQRKDWIRAQDRAGVAHAPGELQYADAVAKSARRVNVLKLSAERAAASQKRAEQAFSMLAGPLERIATHFAMDRLGFESNPIQSLERIAA